MGRLNDSLRVKDSLRVAARHYRMSADSLRDADNRHKAAYQSEQVATANLGVLLGNSEAVGEEWKAKAQRRGVLNWVLGTLGSALVVSVVKKAVN